MVTRLVVYTQKSYMHSTCRKHWYLELGIDRGSAPRFWSDCWHQIHIRLNVTLGLSGETFDTPNNGLLLWLILCAAKRMLDLRFGGVFRYRDLDYHMRCEKLV